MNAPHSVTANFTASSGGNGYTHSRAVTIAHGQVPNTDQGNFPLLFNTTDPLLKTVANAGHVNNANGYDIIFTSDAAGTQKLNHEIEFYDGSAGKFIAWVQIPTLSHSADTLIYLFYGNSSVNASQENKAAVWDSNYKAVYHMADKAANTTVMDSTGSNNGTARANTSSKTTNGEIDGALSFNGSSDFVTIPQNGHFNLHAGPFTIETWIKDDSTAANLATFHRIVSWFDGTNNIQLGLGQDSTAAKRSFYLINAASSALPSVTSSGSVPTGLNHLVVSFDGSGYHIYLNGTVANGGSLKSGAVTAFTSNSTSLYLGQRGDGNTATFVNGVLDELRISNTVRSSDWIGTEYNNQSNPSTFYSLGAEQSH
jgi:hypothetical protein